MSKPPGPRREQGKINEKREPELTSPHLIRKSTQNRTEKETGKNTKKPVGSWARKIVLPFTPKAENTLKGKLIKCTSSELTTSQTPTAANPTQDEIPHCVVRHGCDRVWGHWTLGMALGNGAGAPEATWAVFYGTKRTLAL